MFSIIPLIFAIHLALLLLIAAALQETTWIVALTPLLLVQVKVEIQVIGFDLQYGLSFL